MRHRSAPNSWFGGLLLALPWLNVGCQPVEQVHAADDVAAMGVAVRLSPVTHDAVNRNIERPGVLLRKSSAELSFKIGGLVQSVLVDTGSRVRRGQVLATLNATEASALEQQARHLAEKATRDLTRMRELNEAGSAPRIELQNATTQSALADAVLSNANYQSYHTKLYAPDDGVIDLRTIEVGEMVAPSRVAFRMSGEGRGAVIRVAVTDRDLLAMNVGDPASVTLDALPEKTLRGTISTLATVASPGTGMFDVEVLLDKAGIQRLPSGLTARVSFAMTMHPVATVPVTALVDGSGSEAAVFVVANGHAQRIPVLVSFLYGDRAALARGLEDAESVVGVGSAQLTDGATVRIVR